MDNEFIVYITLTKFTERKGWMFVKKLFKPYSKNYLFLHRPRVNFHEEKNRLYAPRSEWKKPTNKWTCRRKLPPMNTFFKTKNYIYTSGFWPRVRARALRAPVFWNTLPCQTGAARPTPPIAASLLLIRPPKIYKISRTWAVHVKGFFLSTGPQRLWGPLPPSHPSQLRWSFRQCFGVKSIYRCDHTH